MYFGNDTVCIWSIKEEVVKPCARNALQYCCKKVFVNPRIGSANGISFQAEQEQVFATSRFSFNKTRYRSLVCIRWFFDAGVGQSVPRDDL